MNKEAGPAPTDPTDPTDPTEQAIRRRAERMQHRRLRPGPSPLRGLSALGVLGWSIALPSVGGALLGLWLNRVAPQAFSWPLALMLGGLMIGIVVAGEWMLREAQATRNSAARDAQQPAKTPAPPLPAAPPAAPAASAPLPSSSPPSPEPDHD